MFERAYKAVAGRGIGRIGRGGLVTVSLKGDLESVVGLATELVLLLDDDPALSKRDKHRQVKDAVVQLLDDIIVFGGPAGGILEQVDGLVLSLIGDAIITSVVRGRRATTRGSLNAKQLVKRIHDGRLDGALPVLALDDRSTVTKAVAARLAELKED